MVMGTRGLLLAAAFAAMDVAAFAGSRCGTGNVGSACGDAECPKVETLTLESGSLKAVVVPAWGGRLMFLGRPGGRNALWTDCAASRNTADGNGNDVWKNVGGEKTWVGTMPLWRNSNQSGKMWPPPQWFDSGMMEVVRADATNVLLRTAQQKMGGWTVSLEREFTLAGDRLVLRETLVAPDGGDPVEDDSRRVWSVTQVPLVDKVSIRSAGRRRAIRHCDSVSLPPAKDGWTEVDLTVAKRHGRCGFDGDATAADIPGVGRLVIEQRVAERHLKDALKNDLFNEPSRAIVYTTGRDFKPSTWSGFGVHPYVELEFVALGPDAEQTLTFRIEDDSATADESRIAKMREDKLGMFIHWGIYSIPANPTGEWTMNKDRIPAAEYNRYAEQFNPPAAFSPREWVRLAKRAGCRYAVLTTRHHDGFCLFDTKTTDFSSVKTAAKRDFVREFAEACRAEGIRVGFYFSIMNWQYDHSPKGVFSQSVWDAQVRTTHEALRELMTNYGKVDYLWYDGCSAPGSVDSEHMERMWRIREMNAMVRRLQPDILINSRSSQPEDYATPEQCLTPPPRGRMWESCITCNGSWGYVKGDNDWKSGETLIRSLLHCARFGGNILINAGPRSDGSIPEECVLAFETLGDYVAKCPQSIYGAERDDWTETTHEAGVVTKANGSYWLHTFGKPPRLDGAETVEKAADGIYRVAFRKGARPCNWLGGRHDIALKAGAAPVLGDDTGRFMPPTGDVEPTDGKTLAFVPAAGGEWRFDIGFVNADGFKDTYSARFFASGGERVMLSVPGAKGTYAKRMTPVWRAVDPKSWRVAGKFGSRFYETGYDAKAAEEVFAKDLLAEANAATFVPVPPENDKGDESAVRLNHNYSDPKPGIGYSFARRNFASDSDRTVYAAFGADWWGRVYVNGEIALDTVTGWKPKPFALKLKKGDNDILVVTHGGSRAHWFTFYVNDVPQS